MTGSEPTLPLTANSRLVASPKTFGMMFLVALGFEGFMQLLAPPPNIGAFIHSSAPSVLILIFSVLTLPILLGVQRQTIIMDQKGILLESSHRKYLYVWSDIAEVNKNTQNGVRISMVEQTAAQNAYNIIPARFGFDQNTLFALTQEGIKRWGKKGSSSEVGGSFTPGDEARRVSRSQNMKILMMLGALFCILLLCLFVPTFFSTRDNAILAKRGVRFNANVVRLYTGDCSKRGCSQKIQYSFRPPDSPLLETGYDRLGAGSANENKHRAYVERTGSVPIAYDPVTPSRFRLNFDDNAFRGNPWRGFISIASIIFIMMVAIYAIFLLIFWNAWRKEIKKLPADRPPPELR